MPSGEKENGPIFSRPFLAVLLAVSVAANIILFTQLRFPGFVRKMRLVLVPAPTVTVSDHVRGRPDAKYTVIEYADFQCPYCTEFHDAMKTVMKERDVRWVYRHFPLPAHPLAQKAALATECAHEQGKFWEYADGLYGLKTITDGDFLRLAGALDLDVFFFGACLATGKFKDVVAAQQESGVRSKVEATPTFFLNDKRFEGYVPAEELMKMMGGNSR